MVVQRVKKREVTKQMMRAISLAIFSTFIFSLAAIAQPSCSSGQHVAWARIQLPSGNSNVTAVKQFAWDGGQNIVEVCDLTGNATSLGSWQLFSGEIDQRYPGICVGVGYGGAALQYSCASPRSVRTAFGSPTDTMQSELRFSRWGAGLVAN
jgi:hypothetical protein